MKNIKLLIFALFISLSFSGYGQTTIYSEDFTGQLNKGASYDATIAAPNIVEDVSGVDWTIDMGTCVFDGTQDRFRVIAGARFLEGRDLDGSATWLSPVIDISSFTNVQFSLDASESNGTTGNNLEFDDTFVTEYRVDGGTWTGAATNGSLSDDFDPTVVSQGTTINGTTLELRVIMTNNANNERMRLDNILVEGTAPAGPIIITSTSSITGISTVQNNVPLVSDTYTVQAYGLNVGTNVDIASQNGNLVFATVANGPYTTTLALPTTAGDLALTTIYVKPAFGLAVGGYTDSIVNSGTPLLFFDTLNIISVSGTTLAHTPVTVACSELIISEFHERASGNESYIELYNPTASAIDLSNYQLARFVNGRVNFGPRIRTLTGSIAANSTFLISRNGSTLCSSGDADLCTGGAMNFDGNDVMALQSSNGVNIDVVGVINVNNQYGQNVNLVRDQDVQLPTVTYDPSGEWTSNPSNNTSRLGFHISDCRCPNTTTYTAGVWDNGVPTSSFNAIINDDYDTNALSAGITACSLTVNSGVTLTVDGDFTIDVDTNVINNGTISVTTDGAFLQNDDDGAFANVGSGTSSITKSAAPLNSLAEYTYWSSPVQGEVVLDVFPSIHQNRRYWYDASNYLDAFFENMNDGTMTAGGGIDDEDDNGDDWQILSTAATLEPGVGFITYPATGSATDGVTRQPYTFTGAFNTGTIAVPVYKNNSELDDNNTNLIGNPYPSAVDADAFFLENGPSGTNVIEPMIYLWSHDSPVSSTTNGNQDLNYGNADYAVINAGSGEVAGGDGIIPDRFIPSGQGFMVHFSDSSTGDVSEGGDIFSNNVIFNNSMRATGNNTQFFRTSNNQNTTSNKMWFNLTSDNGVFSQILVSYIDGATAVNDGTYYDAPRNLLGYNACIYSTMFGETKGFAIQGKASSDLTLNEEIPLGIYTIIDEPTTYTLSIAQLQGTFATSNTIFLEDALLNTTHNLSSSDYTFTSAVGQFNDRFKIVFTTNTLSTDSFETMSQTISIVELQDDNVKFSIASNELTIKSVKILDLLGRTVYNFDGRESTEIFNLTNISKSIYVAQIELSNGIVVSKKAVKK